MSPDDVAMPTRRERRSVAAPYGDTPLNDRSEGRHEWPTNPAPRSSASSR
jgi:hypothetical protein